MAGRTSAAPRPDLTSANKKDMAVEAILQRNEDYGLMLEWFDREGYDVDLEMMRVFNPWIHKFEDWVRETGWANEDCTTPLSGKVDEL